MANIASKSLTILLIVWMLIGVVVSTPLKTHGSDAAPLVADVAAGDAGIHSAGMRGCNGGGAGRPPGPPPSTTTTTASSG